MTRRAVLAAGVVLGCTMTAFGPAQASDWPQRPVTLVVPQAAGNSPDVMARIVADRLSRALGQQFVVENKPGASNVVGTQFVARAAPDGYTLLFATSAALVMNPHTFKSLSYDPLKELVPVGMVARSQQVVAVNKDVQANTLAELIALDKADPGSLSVSVNSPRNLTGLIAQAINKESGSEFVLVSYQQTAQAVQDTISGRADFTIQGISLVEPFVKDGSLRLISVVGDERLEDYPEVKALSEEVPGVDLEPWFMIMAPAGLPEDIARKISDVLKTLNEDEDYVARAAPLGFSVKVGEAVTPSGASAFLNDQYASVGAIVKGLGIEPE